MKSNFRSNFFHSTTSIDGIVGVYSSFCMDFFPSEKKVVIVQIPDVRRNPVIVPQVFSLEHILSVYQGFIQLFSMPCPDNIYFDIGS